MSIEDISKGGVPGYYPTLVGEYPGCTPGREPGEYLTSVGDDPVVYPKRSAGHVLHARVGPDTFGGTNTQGDDPEPPGIEGPKPIPPLMVSRLVRV